jgi:hypothetical protein
MTVGITLIRPLVYYIILSGLPLYFSQHPIFSALQVEDSVSSDDVEGCVSAYLDSLHALLNTNFFRHFKINLSKKCPYWDEAAICFSPNCAVQPLV